MFLVINYNYMKVNCYSFNFLLSSLLFCCILLCCIWLKFSLLYRYSANLPFLCVVGPGVLSRFIARFTALFALFYPILIPFSLLFLILFYSLLITYNFI